MGQVIINGKSYVGNNVTITNGKVIIDGHEYDESKDVKIDIQINGNIETLKVDVCKSIYVEGNVHDLVTTSGDVKCGNVTGDVSTTSGDIEAKNVSGNVKTVSGDVEADEIGGNVKTVSGDIN